MKTYDVSITRSEFGFVTVEADSEAEAKKKALLAEEQGDFECCKTEAKVTGVQYIKRNN